MKEFLGKTTLTRPPTFSRTLAADIHSKLYSSMVLSYLII